MREKVVGEQYLVLVVQSEERLQHILLAPELMVLHHQLTGIFAWKENVVNLDDHPGLQPGQDVKGEKVDISADSHDMGRVDEQDVVLDKLFELFEADVFHL